MNKDNRTEAQKPTEEQILMKIKKHFELYYENRTQPNKEGLVMALKTYIWEYSKGLWEDINDEYINIKKNFNKEELV